MEDIDGASANVAMLSPTVMARRDDCDAARAEAHGRSKLVKGVRVVARCGALDDVGCDANEPPRPALLLPVGKNICPERKNEVDFIE